LHLPAGLSAKGSGSSKNRLEGSDRDEFNTHMFQQRQLVAMRYAYKKVGAKIRLSLLILIDTTPSTYDDMIQSNACTICKP